MTDPSELYEAIIDGDESKALQLIKQSIDEGADPVDLIARWMVPAMMRWAGALSKRRLRC